MYCGSSISIVLDQVCDGLHNVSAALTTTPYSSTETDPCFGIYESITGMGSVATCLLHSVSYVQLHL